MNTLKSILIVLFLTVVASAKAGFPLGKGGYMVVPTYNLYTANGYWDQSKVYKAYTGSEKFTSNYFGVYGGFGLSRDLDFMYNVPFVIQSYTSPEGKISKNAGLGDATAGLTYYLNHFNGDKHLSISGSLILPLYQNIEGNTPYLGIQEFGFEGKLGLAGSKEIGFKNAYYDMEGGFRQFFSAVGPSQLFANITGGIQVNDFWKISGTLSILNSTSSSTTTNIGTNLFGNRDFGYTRLTANAGYIINPNTTLWGSLFTDISGRNTGKGSGLGLFLVIKF